MTFAEIVVNVPIRRTFYTPDNRTLESGPPASAPAALADEYWDDLLSDVPPDADLISNLQTFHYHLPLELENRVLPGHLVWAPFGRQEVQGIVLRLTREAPVTTKPLIRLARPEPVLTAAQLGLAAWIADYYVAPLSEAIKLFFPPGLLEKQGGESSVHTKRELVVTLAIPAAEAEQRLLELGRSTQMSAALAWLVEQPSTGAPIATLKEACRIKHPKPLQELVARGLVEIAEGHARLAVSPEVARQAILEMRGADKYAPVVQALSAASGPLWKSELYAQVDTDLAALRVLQAAGIVQLDERARFRDPLAGRTYACTTPPQLTGEQAQVWETICQRAFASRIISRRRGTGALAGKEQDEQANKAAMFLIHGVTGSGKTEIYLRAIAEILELGRQAIVLVPEIALTPQTVARFAGRFPQRVMVVHSGLSRGERYDVWRKIRDGEYDVVIGPRSALFAPLSRLGLIVIDEEHEPSYKQDAEVWGSLKVFYDARMVARRLAEMTSSVLILGSATPSLESYAEAERGEIVLLNMPRRVIGHRTGSEYSGPDPLYAEMPPVEIVDMRQELRAGNRSIMSRTLQAELHATLGAGEQAILFLNRRGTNTFVLCRDCGDVQRCTRCDSPLTYHDAASQLVCHRCNQRYPIPTVCPQCQSKRIKYFGSGTQRIEDVVLQLVPQARVLRWDADTTGRRGSHEAILERFANHEADVLVGTQMIAKGLDLPLVTLVGVISADVSLYLPDFRAGERTFQLLAQVAGRAGRSQRGGRVVLQTYRPEHYVIQAAARHDYGAFYQRELSFRRERGYPPVKRLVRLVYWDKKAEKAEQIAQRMAEALRSRMAAVNAPVTLLGPAPAFFARHRGYYRWQIVLYGQEPSSLLRGLPIPFGWRVDVDPVTVL
jgi:primosomal protein N' (replication factor Y)